MASRVRDHHNLRRNLNLNDNYISNDGGDEGVRITDAGLVGIGNPAPGSTLEVTTVASTAVSNVPVIEISSFSDATDDTRAAGILKFHKSQNDTVNSYGADSHTRADEVIGSIEAWGVDNAINDNDAPTMSSYIQFRGDAVSNATSVPGKIIFATSDNNDAGSPTVRMTLDDSGQLGIGVTDPDELLEVAGDIHVHNTVYFSSETANTIADGATGEIDWNVSQKQKVTITGTGITCNFANPGGVCNLLLKVIQGDGSDVIGTWDSDIKWVGGSAPTLSTGNGDIDILSFYFDGTNYFGAASLNFD